jgi:hypothetical protein
MGTVFYEHVCLPVCHIDGLYSIDNELNHYLFAHSIALKIQSVFLITRGSK